jgi:hypothetical protein
MVVCTISSVHLADQAYWLLAAVVRTPVILSPTTSELTWVRPEGPIGAESRRGRWNFEVVTNNIMVSLAQATLC